MDNYGKTPAERTNNFDAAHGASIYDGVWVYFEDGASREGNPLGAMHEPSADPQQRHRRIVFYYQLLLERQVREFDAFKKTLLEHPGMYPDNEKNLADLRRMRGGARRARRKLRDAQGELKKHLPSYLPPEEQAKLDEAMARTATVQANYRNALDAITI